MPYNWSFYHPGPISEQMGGIGTDVSLFFDQSLWPHLLLIKVRTDHLLYHHHHHYQEGYALSNQYFAAVIALGITCATEVRIVYLEETTTNLFERFSKCQTMSSPFHWKFESGRIFVRCLNTLLPFCPTPAAAAHLVTIFSNTWGAAATVRKVSENCSKMCRNGS